MISQLDISRPFTVTCLSSLVHAFRAVLWRREGLLALPLPFCYYASACLLIPPITHSIPSAEKRDPSAGNISISPQNRCLPRSRRHSHPRYTFYRLISCWPCMSMQMGDLKMLSSLLPPVRELPMLPAFMVAISTFRHIPRPSITVRILRAS
jgi:hypothetical protein